MAKASNKVLSSDATSIYVQGKPQVYIHSEKEHSIILILLSVNYLVIICSDAFEIVDHLAIVFAHWKRS